MLLLVLRRRLAGRTILAAVGLLAAVVLADLRMTQLIAVGEARGDWSLALTFSAVPALGIVYRLALLRSVRTTSG